LALAFPIADTNSLYEIGENASSPLTVRCGSVFLAFLIDRDSSNLLRFVEQLNAGLASGKAKWITTAVVDMFLMCDSDKDPNSRKVVAALLATARGDWSSTMRLPDLLQSWRECSHAPLHQAGVTEA
jgi:hypothetical protein